MGSTSKQATERLTWHVLDATADDWESIDQIESHVLRYCGHVDRESIASTIIELKRDGLLEEMQHEGLRQLAASSSDILTEPVEHWFCMTKAGRALWEAEGSKHCADES